MEKEELKTIKDILEFQFRELMEDIKQSRIDHNILIAKTIDDKMNEKEKAVDKKMDSLHEKIDIMEIENKARGTAIYDIGEKLQKFVARLEPVAKAFETNKLFSSMLVSKVKFSAMIAGSIIAISAGLGLIIKSLVKLFIEK